MKGRGGKRSRENLFPWFTGRTSGGNERSRTSLSWKVRGHGAEERVGGGREACGGEGEQSRYVSVI